jgi:hypothetical protein
MAIPTKINVLTFLALVLVIVLYMGNLKLDVPVNQANNRMLNDDNNKKQTQDQYAKKYNTISNYNCNSSINPCK